MHGGNLHSFCDQINYLYFSYLEFAIFFYWIYFFIRFLVHFPHWLLINNIKRKKKKNPSDNAKGKQNIILMGRLTKFFAWLCLRLIKVYISHKQKQQQQKKPTVNSNTMYGIIIPSQTIYKRFKFALYSYLFNCNNVANQINTGISNTRNCIKKKLM